MDVFEIKQVQSAERLALPKSGDAKAAWTAFMEATNIEIPDFPDGRLWAKSGGRTFWILRGDDVPRAVGEGRVDVGLTTTEACEEFGDVDRILWQRIGEPLCRYSVLTDEERTPVFYDLLAGESRYPKMTREIAATYPRLLNVVAAARDLPLVARSGLRITGSGEAWASLTGDGVVADRVSTGRTAQQNGLTEVFELCQLYPEVVMRRENA